MDLVAYDPVSKMVALHDGPEFLRFKLVDQTLAKIKEFIAGTYFEDKYNDIVVAFPMSLGFSQVDQFRRMQARVRQNGPRDVSEYAMLMPGVDSWVRHPETGEHNLLYYIIQSLNDSFKWTREQIADWIESLDIDARF